jgi:hypothetical protein
MEQLCDLGACRITVIGCWSVVPRPFDGTVVSLRHRNGLAEWRLRQ